MSRTWIILGSILAVVSLGAVTYNLVSLIAHEEVRRTEVFDAADVADLEVQNDSGTVEILGDPALDEIRVAADIDHGLRRTTLDIEVVDGTLVIDTDCPIGLNTWCRVDLRLHVPSSLPVAVDNGNGRVTIRDLTAGLVAHTSNGRIEAARIAGTVELSTSNGAIGARGLDSTSTLATTSNGSIELVFAAGPDDVTARTSNGSIEIVVPDDAGAYRIDADTSFVGSIDTAVRTDPASDRSISTRTSNGSITVRYPDG